MLDKHTVRGLALGLLLLFLFSAGSSLRYTFRHLGINTDTAAMISEELPFRQAYERYRQAFPALVDRFVVVVDGSTPETADTAVRQLAAKLRLEPEVFTDIHLPGEDPFFARNAFLYLSETDLEALSDRLIEVQPLIGRLNRDPSLTTLADILTGAMDESAEDHDLPLEPLFTELNQTLEAMLSAQPYEMSWRRLLSGEIDREQSLRRYLLLKPTLDFSEPLAAEPAMLAVREAADEIRRGSLENVRVRVTGDAALGYEELISALEGARKAGMLALIMVTLILFIGLRSVWLVLASVLTLTVGLILTAGFATVAVGHLNLISVAFAVLYIGLGVDYAIHLCLRYRELLMHGEPKFAAVTNAISSIGGSLLLCTLTTATAFYAFVPTAFSGVSELGLISGTGMFINFAVSLCLLPACLILFPAPTIHGRIVTKLPAAGFLETPVRHARFIRVSALVLGIGAIMVVPQLRFDRNQLNLRDQNSESIVTILELMEDGELPAMSITVLAPDASTAARQAAELRSLAVVSEVIGATDFLPEITDQKRAVIDDLSLVLGASLDPVPARPARSDPETIEALTVLERQLRRFGQDARTRVGDADRFAARLAELLVELRRLDDADRKARLEELHRRLLGNLPESLNRLRDALNPVTTDPALPEQTRRRWTNPQGLIRLAVYPREDINDNAALRRFVDGVQSVAPDATDEPVLSIAAGDAVVDAFRQAFVSAIIVITALLLVLLRDLRSTLLVLTPLILAALLTTGVMTIFDLPFNFANVIALPLLFGIGVDNSIHMVLRSGRLPDTGRDAAENPLCTSTARAIWFSSLTTICSFGNLIFSPHAGTASMGLLLSIGTGMTIICTLVVLPALLRPKFPVARRSG